MGNAKSRTKNSTKFDKEIARNLIDSSLLTPTSENQINRKKDIINVCGRTTATTTTSTTAAFAVENPLLVGVKNTATNKNTSKSNKALKEPQQTQEQFYHKQRQQKAADNSAAASAAEPQHLKQSTSFWSLSSLNWKLSYSGRNSYKQRPKSFRKDSSSTLQYQRKRSKTQWHKPLTNAIFHSHFKESSRNKEFHIDQLVAKGAFGVVFKVIDKKSIKDGQQQHQPPVYALKVLKKSKIISDNSLQQIKDEVDIQKVCGHYPFIVKQFDLWQNRYNLHILSEYLPNGELFCRITKFSLNLIRLYLAEIALALDFLHNAGIIYRDAKPENILLTRDFHLKLTDFGLCKWLKLGLTTKTICGTFQYMAPEILRGEAYTHAVDWWSLGIIVCQMFVEKSPDVRKFIIINLPQDSETLCNANHSKESVNAIVTERPAIDNFLPLEVESLCHEAKDVLKRLLEFDAQKRLRSVRALQKIAMYKDFKIESHYCLKISPLDIIENENIIIERSLDEVSNSCSAAEAFKNF